MGIGACLSYSKNTSHSKIWVGNHEVKNSPVIVTIIENIAIKEKSYKALATVEAVFNNGVWQSVEGDILLYFKKTDGLPNIHYGSQIIITNNLNHIINSGNPGGFNYSRYCSFQGIYFQGFLQKGDYLILSSNKKDWFVNKLIQARTNVLSTLKKYIKGENEISIAEALLIGYRDELNRDLVRAYSNTGVVHIIAISGLHLGMIYGLIIFLFKPFVKFKWSKLVKALTIVIVLWMFSFIAGMPPSILRSAIMFSCIALGDLIGKKNNIYNGLSLSAIIILIINPFALWDVGFQLSYSAVISIVIFSPYIKKWIYFKNKLLAGFWNLNAITLSAQILTLPIVLYHFHQFPNLFIFTNLFAVPFSGLILYAEILLIIFSFWNGLAIFLGSFSEWGISILNKFILNVDILPFAVWESIQINIIQSIFLYGVIISFISFLIFKKAKYFVVGSFFLCLFFMNRTLDFLKSIQQKKIIVYNVPSHTAIDIVDSRSFIFNGSDILKADGFLRNFHIKPSRVLHRISKTNSLKNIYYSENLIISKNRKILVVNKRLNGLNNKTNWDAIILTKNPKISIADIVKFANCKSFVFDGSNSLWKINQWKRECDSLHLQYHICSLNGAFEMNL